MTTALDSVESIVLMARHFFSENMHPYFNSEYLDVCKHMIGIALGTTQFKYVQTIVSLPEPIWCSSDGDIVVISVPMMQNLLDRPYVVNSKPVEYVENFNIFQKYQMRNGLEKRITECEDAHTDKYAFTTNTAYEKTSTNKRRRDEGPASAESISHSNVILVQWSSDQRTGGLRVLNERNINALIEQIPNDVLRNCFRKKLPKPDPKRIPIIYREKNKLPNFLKNLIVDLRLDDEPDPQNQYNICLAQCFLCGHSLNTVRKYMNLLLRHSVFSTDFEINNALSKNSPVLWRSGATCTTAWSIGAFTPSS